MNRRIVLVVARGRNNAIGREGGLPWHLPADLRHFKQVTMGTPMIMGRKTFDGLPGLLPGRRHIVLTRDQDWSADGAEVAASPEQAITLANAPRISVIGGAQIFALFLPLASDIELTEVDCDAEGDTFIPPFDPDDWSELSREAHAAEGDRPAYSFVSLSRAL